MPDVNLLGDWLLRDYQLPLWDYLRGGGLRAVPVWNRRAGKDEVCLAHCSLSMLERPATYWYMLPMANQARTAIWEAVNPKTGKRRVDEFFPGPLFDKRETDMMIHCRANASTWQLKGSDNYGAGIGSPPAGIVFSEFSQADSMVWGYISPILEENDGWAIFPSTPRGHNHLEDMLNIAREDKTWFGEVLTVDQTKVVSHEKLMKDLQVKQRLFGEAEGKALWLQEWYCSFDAAVPGSYYGDLMMQAEAEGRITEVPYDPRFPVIAVFDLGRADASAIWFVQTVGYQTRCIDYEEKNGVSDIDFYTRLLNEKNYAYARRPLILPHDAAHEKLGMARSVDRQFADLGYANKVLTKSDIDPGIRAARQFLRSVVFDRTKCKRGLECLRNYHREFDPVRKVYLEHPQHDWSSHGADAFRYLSIGYEPAARPDMMANRNEAATGQWRRQALQSRPIQDPWALPSR